MTARLVLGPALFNWEPEVLRDFYFRIADEAPIDAVCLGEVVCSKRQPFFLPYLGAVAERLEAAGKQVIHSTLALIMNERELAQVRETAGLAEAGESLIEANDMSCVSFLTGRRHAIGPFVNVYNEGALDFHVRRGAVRVSLPGELPRRSIAAIAAAAGGQVELEVQVFGRLPLAISARCYHARAHGLQKDGCQYVCGEDPDGLVVETLDDEPFLVINGTQTLSYTYVNLIGEMDELRAMGVGAFRLSPHDADMVAIAREFRDVADGRREAAAARERLSQLTGDVSFSNGFYHGTRGRVLSAA